MARRLFAELSNASPVERGRRKPSVAPCVVLRVSRVKRDDSVNLTGQFICAASESPMMSAKAAVWRGSVDGAMTLLRGFSTAR
jgi:hypothetical protein